MQRRTLRTRRLGWPQQYARRTAAAHEHAVQAGEQSPSVDPGEGAQDMNAFLAQPAMDVPRRKKLVSKSRYIAALQRRHFFVFDIVPNFVALMVVPYHMFVAAVRVSDIAVFLLLWA